MQQHGNAARTVTALLGLVAVGVEYAVIRGTLCVPRWLDHQRLIEADPRAAIGEPLQGIPGGVKSAEAENRTARSRCQLRASS